MLKNENGGDQNLQPDYTTGKAPARITKTGKRDGVFYVAGEGNKESKIMFVATSLLAEEASETASSVTGVLITQKPRYLKGACGATFVDCMSAGGFLTPGEDYYYTALCKWLLPRDNRTRPTKEQIAWGLPALLDEIRTIKPKIVVCLGKPAFDALMNVRITLGDGRGAWFRNNDLGCNVYLMDDVTRPSSKPEFVPVFHDDAAQIRRMLDTVSGVDVKTVERHYRVIRSIDQLSSWVDEMQSEGHKTFSVDCEWGGNNHIDGNLRSLQLCWRPGHACYIRFMDDKGNYALEGGDYKTAGSVLAKLLNRPDVKYIGHHISADLPWMHVWLGLDWHEKVIMDTEFAQQCCDEYEDLSLERLALKYTDLGRYDIDLILWKKANKQKADAGYAFIPDDILIDYACKDVDTVMRAYPMLCLELSRQGLSEYYFKLFNPFVTDVFTCFALTGLPMDVELMDELRDLYTFCRDKLDKILQEDIYNEAKDILYDVFRSPEVHSVSQTVKTRLLSDEDYAAKWNARSRELVEEAATLAESNNTDAAWKLLKKDITDPSVLPRLRKMFDHMVEARFFNIRSGPMMRRWLFEIKGYKPVKSSANREKGLPSLPWEKVEAMPPHAKSLYTPSVDRQSMEILAEKHDCRILHDLLKLNAIGNICKNFLKQPETNSDGDVVIEKGLHYFVCSDGRVHGQYSTTETGRPRAWKPNSLNWPKLVGKQICSGIRRVLNQAEIDGELPDRYRKYLTDEIPSIRSCVKAPDGWCFVESDYQTAEVRGLAFISGDDNLIRIMTEPDKQFALGIDGKQYRVAYDDNCGIPADAQDMSLITDVTSDKLFRDGSGNLVHPSADLHWSLAEMMYGTPRERLDKDIHRAAAKVGNFQSMYGASATTLERKIEQDTGKTPEEGTGERILAALARRQPAATAFLKSMETKPTDPGYLVAASGRKRRFATHARMGARASSTRAEESLVASLGREARNFYMQCSVADTSARAGKWLLDYYLEHGMKARPLVILYDSVVTLCPLEERHVVAELHERFMTTENTWEYFGTTMNYPIDNEYVMRWSTKPTKEEKTMLYSDTK